MPFRRLGDRGFKRALSTPVGWGVNPPPAAAVDPTLILDEFTDSDSTALSAHTISPTNTPSASWADMEFITAGAPTNQIISNQAQVTTNQTGVVADAGVADCTITVDWTPQVAEANRGRVGFRYVSTGNVWAAYMNEPGSTFDLQEITGSTLTQRGTVAQTWVEGTTYEIKIVLSGNDIELFIDGVSKITHTSTSHNTATKHGIGMTSGHSGYFDNFKVVS